tara:strand:+ start:7369 stop:7599 length:231 start_codon:yes stop_codon:yes gene_type:complete
MSKRKKMPGYVIEFGARTALEDAAAALERVALNMVQPTMTAPEFAAWSRELTAQGFPLTARRAASVGIEIQRSTAI